MHSLLGHADSGRQHDVLTDDDTTARQGVVGLAVLVGVLELHLWAEGSARRQQSPQSIALQVRYNIRHAYFLYPFADFW